MFLPSKRLLSAFYKTLPSKKLVFTENPLQAPSKNPSKKPLLLENLLRTLLRSVRLHDPLGVHPILGSGTFFFIRRVLQPVRRVCFCFLFIGFCLALRREGLEGDGQKNVIIHDMFFDIFRL